jgi:MFS family permease
VDPRRARGTIVGSVAGAISAKGSGLDISSADVAGLAASLYVAGACFGALVFGQLTDRFGRKKLFMITLGVYLAATFATAFSWTPVWFFACRFITGMGIRLRVTPAQSSSRSIPTTRSRSTSARRSGWPRYPDGPARLSEADRARPEPVHRWAYCC